jgi:hypothetical protein
MSHWAEIDENNIVLRVLVGPNHGDEGEAFFNGLGGTWVKTSYNGNIRKNYAGIGYSYWPDIDAFVAPQCHDIAVLDETTALWNCTHEDHTPIEMKEIN